jgi:hypothetical protein
MGKLGSSLAAVRSLQRSIRLDKRASVQDYADGEAAMPGVFVLRHGCHYCDVCALLASSVKLSYRLPTEILVEHITGFAPIWGTFGWTGGLLVEWILVQFGDNAVHRRTRVPTARDVAIVRIAGGDDANSNAVARLFSPLVVGEWSPRQRRIIGAIRPLVLRVLEELRGPGASLHYAAMTGDVGACIEILQDI